MLDGFTKPGFPKFMNQKCLTEKNPFDPELTLNGARVNTCPARALYITLVLLGPYIIYNTCPARAVYYI